MSLSAKSSASFGSDGAVRFGPEGLFEKSSQNAVLKTNSTANRLISADRAPHDWYRFVLSFPAHLVRDYLEEFQAAPEELVFDPFCGTGTTLVEARKLGISSIGMEAHPTTHFAARTKLKWDVDPAALLAQGQEIAAEANGRIESAGLIDDPQGSLLRETPPFNLLRLPPEKEALLLKNSISPLPLHKTLVLLDIIEKRGMHFCDHFRLALARELVASIGNLHFGPEVGVGTPKEDAPVVGPWLDRIHQFAADLEILKKLPHADAAVLCGDSRQLPESIPKESIDFIFTSPPYPNEKDYTRTTRLESVILGFISTKAELREIKRSKLLRSNTRNVYKSDDDDAFVVSNKAVQRIANAIEQRRIELGKTSGFERLYHRVAKLYFGGMTRHLAALREKLKPGARLAYVVGDQASYLRIMIRTGQLLGEIAEGLGYELERIDLFRTRLATATRAQLREEIVILRWPGGKTK